MKAAIDFLSSQIENLQKQGIEITIIRDDIINEKVIVGILDLTEEKEKKVRALMDCPFLQFEEGEHIENQVYLSPIGGGEGIVSQEDGLDSTICCAAQRNGRYGFVISGHAGNRGERFLYNNVEIGKVERTAYRDGSTADAAFLIGKPGTYVTNVIKGHNVIGGVKENLPVNTSVQMHGAVSGHQSGKILSYYITSRNEKGVTFCKQALANYNSVGGDSGAPILVYIKGKYHICGIHKGSQESNGNKIFSPFSNIVNELGISFVNSQQMATGSYK